MPPKRPSAGSAGDPSRKPTTTSQFKPPRPAQAQSQPQRGSSGPSASTKRKPRPSDPEPNASDDDDDETTAERADDDDANAPRLPGPLLTKLMHEHFRDEGTRIGKEAHAAVGRYVETFVREAIARAAFEREKRAGSAEGGGDGYLEVEDLEKLAPQLLLDF